MHNLKPKVKDRSTRQQAPVWGIRVDSPTTLSNPVSNAVHDIIWLSEVNSTNDYLMELTRVNSKSGLTVVAEYQPLGKGRFSRRWDARRGENLTFSTIIKPNVALAESGLATLAVATAVATAIQRTIDTPVTIRWPNDIIVEGRKIAGILSEVSAIGTELVLVVGIGINVNQVDFSMSRFRTPPTSARLETGHHYPLPQFLTNCLSDIQTEVVRLASGDKAGCRARFIEKCIDIGKVVSFVHSPGSQPRISTIVGIALDGGMEILADGKLQVVYAGEISSERLPA